MDLHAKSRSHLSYHAILSMYRCLQNGSRTDTGDETRKAYRAQQFNQERNYHRHAFNSYLALMPVLIYKSIKLPVAWLWFWCGCCAPKGLLLVCPKGLPPKLLMPAGPVCAGIILFCCPKTPAEACCWGPPVNCWLKNGLFPVCAACNLFKP